jgi:hypothetical protein
LFALRSDADAREREVARFPKACYGREEKPLLRTNSTSSINADAEKCQTGGVPAIFS